VIRALISTACAWARRVSLRHAVKAFFDGPHIIRDIHLDGIIHTFRNTDSVSVFKGPQLLKFLQGFESPFGKRCELKQKIHSEAIEPQMLEMDLPGIRVPAEGNGASGKIEGKSLVVRHHFYMVGIGHIPLIPNSTFKGTHGDGFVCYQRFNHGGNHLGLKSRLIPLDVHHQITVLHTEEQKVLD